MSAAARKAAVARAARWAAANRDKTRANKRRWLERNRDKKNAQTARWQRDNPESARAACRRWHANNPHKVVAKNATRRARLREAEVPLTNEEQASIIALYAKARALTELTGEPYHVDHIKPISKGGLHHPSNLQVLRGIDNLRKGNKT